MEPGNDRDEVTECLASDEKIEHYLARSEEGSTIYNIFVGEMYNIIATKKLTHYIFRIKLGATVFYKTRWTLEELKAGFMGDIQLPRNLDFEGSLKFMKRRNMCEQQTHRIGSFDDDNDVHTIECSIKPVYTLLNHRHTATRKAFEKAIQSYIERERKQRSYYCNFGCFVHRAN